MRAAHASGRPSAHLAAPLRLVLAASCALAAACGQSGQTDDEADGGHPDLVQVVLAPPLDGGFVEVAGAAPFAFPPLDPNGQTDPPLTSGLIADLDGDGTAEVVLMLEGANDQSLAHAYRYTGGLLVADDSLLPSTQAPVAILDLDGDGAVDVLYTGEIDWGDGHGHFASSGPLPADVRNAALWDFDGDGSTDIVSGQWCSRPNLLLQTAPRHFVDAGAMFPESSSINVNATFAGRVGDHVVVAVLGHDCMDSGTEVPIVYQLDGGVFHESSLLGDVRLSSFTPMGATSGGDLDGDGQLDLLVLLDPEHVFFSGTMQRAVSFADVLSDKGAPMLAWTALLLDLDYDGRQDVLFTHGTDGFFGNRLQTIGHERTTGHWNGGTGFGRVATLGDLDRLGEWRILGVGDLDGDGDPDVVLGGFGEDPRVYRNDLRGHGVALRVLNRRGAPAWGATMELRAGATTQRLEVVAIATQEIVNEPLLFAGLGPATQGTLVVHFPDGNVQTASVTAGRVNTIVEE